MSPVLSHLLLPVFALAAIVAAIAYGRRWLRPRIPDVDRALGTAVPPPVARALTLAGGAAVVASTFLSWTWSSVFPGDLTVNGYPGGNQVLTLILGALALLVLAASVGVPGLRWIAPGGATRALQLLGLGALTATGYTVAAIAAELGGAVNVDPGGWVAVAGCVVLLGGALLLPRDARPVPPARRLPAVIEMLLILAGTVIALIAVTYGVQTGSAENFIAYLITVPFAAGGLAASGLLPRFSQTTRRWRAATITAVFLMAFVFPFTQNGNDSYTLIAVNVMIFGTTALGLNIVVGLAGLLDLGYVAFLGFGAYVAAIVSGSSYSPFHVHLPFIAAVGLGAAASAVFGVLIGAPTLRLRGDYLAIVTLGFGEIFHLGALNLNGTSGPNVTNGPNGIPGVPDLVIPKGGGFNGWDFFDPHQLHIGGLTLTLGHFSNYYLLMLLFMIVVVLVFARANNSRIGRAWVAIREDETAAGAMGINTFRLKLIAFALGATLAGFAGTVQAHTVSTVTPDQFQFINSTLLLAAVVMGGMGTIPGPLLGATVLILIPEKLRFFQDYRLLIFGLVLILMMRFRPEGIISSRRRRLEFHEETAAAEAADSAVNRHDGITDTPDTTTEEVVV